MAWAPQSHGWRVVGLLFGLLLGIAGCAVPTPRPTPAPPAPVQVTPAPAEAPTETPRVTQEPPAAPAPPPVVPAPPVRPPAAPAPATQRFVVLNFDNADIESVIHAASEIVGFNYVLAPDVRGKVTIQTSGRIAQQDVFKVLLAVLEVHGFTAVKSDNLYKIVKTAAAKERPVPTVIGSEPDSGRAEDEVITQIVPLSFASAAEIGTLLRPLVSTSGSVIIHRDTNLLILTEAAGNIRRLLQIIKVMDVQVSLDELRVFPVRYADATELAAMLNQLFAAGRPRAGVAEVPPATPPTPVQPGAPPRPAAPTPVPAPTAERRPLILADKRTNSLLVLARRSEFDLIARVLEQLDVETKANKRIFVYYVENVKAKELAATLTAVFAKGEGAPARPPTERVPPGAPVPTPPARPPAARTDASRDVGEEVVEGEVKIVADEPTNTLIITTFSRNWPLIEETIKKLDRAPRQVLIEVLVAEISLDDTNQLGIEWSIRNQSPIKIGDQVFSFGTTTSFIPPRPAGGPAGVVPFQPGLNFFVFETDRLLSLLRAFAAYNKINVLSSPHILTSENKKAVINVSRSVPVPTQALTTPIAGQQQQQQQIQTTVTSNIEFRDAGIILTVTPRISEKRMVSMDIKQEANDVAPTAGFGGAPIILKREAETSVVVADGQTLVLGGLIKENTTFDRSGIPGLSRIPILGYLFGATSVTTSKTELIILVTPRVVGNPQEAKELYEQYRQRTPSLEEIVRRAPATVPPPAAPEPPPLERRDWR